ncbi:MAG: PolC-type DNA polymerase III [Clostridia bacterium]|nr:PolC-type DNA polymerase III [Clostridia bacterium]
MVFGLKNKNGFEHSDDFQIGEYLKNGIIEIVSAVHRKDGAVEVRISASRILSEFEIRSIDREISVRLYPASAECIFDFGSALSIEKFDAETLRELWCEFSPQLEPILRLCRITGGGDSFAVSVSPRYMLALSNGLINDFRAHISSVYSWQTGISVVADEKLADGLDSEAAPVVTKDWGGLKGPATDRRRRATREKPKRLAPSDVIFGKEILKPDMVMMSELTDRSGKITVKGEMLGMEVFVSKRGTTVLTLTLTDKTNTAFVKLFLDDMSKARTVPLLEKAKKEPCLLMVRGRYSFDSYARDYCIFADDINRLPLEVRTDTAEVKRVELHLHTQMSAMDATTSVKDVIERAAKWGHKAIAITDHGVVHSFPEAKKAAKKNGIKVIFGCEGYLVPDCELVPINENDTYCALGFVHSGEGAHARFFELAAVKFDANGNKEVFRTAVNPGVDPSESIRTITGFSEEDIAKAPALIEAARMLGEFIDKDGGCAGIFVHEPSVLALVHELCRGECALPKACVSSGMLMQYLRRDLKSEQRMIEGVSGESAALWTAKTARDLLSRQNALGVGTLPVIDCTEADLEKKRSNHIVILAATQDGLKNLYKLVSYSNLEHFYRTPRIPRSLLNIHREGLILGSACEAGELFRAMVDGVSEDELLKIAESYDYLEVQPIGNNAFLVREGYAEDDEALREFNKRIIRLGEKLDKPVVATGDVHFMEPEDSVFRAILMSAANFKDANIQPPLYFRTTEDMLEEFAYLGEKKAFEIVVENTGRIADMCAELRPFLDDQQTYSPELPNAKEDLQRIANETAHRLYGDILPDVVQKRLDKEKNSIVTNGYSSLYMVAQQLVSKSLSDGYLVGSRGSVGSSFVAYLLGITEVNALPPHYRCEKCRYSEFPDVGDNSRCGIDLPPKNCPVCGEPLRRDGYEIPFETFLGFKGDKTPDIDLNFSGEYQPVAHKFTETMFGEGHAFRAGTISGLQEKTAYGYVLHYCEENGLNLSEAEKTRLASGCVGTRKTTGQHPGGIVIVPKELEIFDFCPVQRPAEKVDAESITTHFDFHALDDKLVKLDILGHDDPTALRMLFDITGIDPKTVPLDDPETMAIFKTDEPLGVSLKALDCDIGSLGISEFGTGFVRGMLKQTRPTTMEELVRIAGLSHGTDVWLGNAQELVENGTANLMQVICTRDDIMNYLIAHGGDPSLSFKTMENVRKGKGLTSDMEDEMHKNNIPQWYIDSCKKIKYMFPRAHAAAYVMMSFRVAYFKVHHPLAYYAVYFTVRADTFDIEKSLGGAERVLKNLNELKALDSLDVKQKEQVIILELVYEMNLRGIELLPIDLYKSKATKFTIEDGKLRPPFNAIAGLGDTAAHQLEEGGKAGKYISREELVKRTKLNNTLLEKLDALGCLGELPKSDQVSLLD